MFNSIKQIFRTPFKMILFLLMVAVSTALLTIGLTLWRETEQKLKYVKQTFTTIGTVEQKESSMSEWKLWDAALKTYTYSNYPIYDKVIPLETLSMKDMEYLLDPEKRPYYGAYMPQYTLMYNMDRFQDVAVVEFSPVEDCIPTEPVLVNIVKVLAGDVYGSEQMRLCDHYREQPPNLEAKKTYIACIVAKENTHGNVQVGTSVEIVPGTTFPHASQYDKTGKEIEGPVNLPEHASWEEVTEDFYSAGRGKYWLNYIDALKKLDHTIPVLPTDSCELLPSMHSGDAAIISGREISADEFADGQNVCMITGEFAELNEIKVGETISLPLYFSNYRESPGTLYSYFGGGLTFSVLDAQGEVYQTFWEADYKVVGIYKYQSVQQEQDVEMGRDMVIIPARSVRASDVNNIVDYGPMLSTTTSFQIPNGSIVDFETAFRKIPESDFLKITYDDNGYERISGEIKNTRKTALLLCMTGLLSTLTIFFLLLYFFIVKQKKRTAVERSLGMTKSQCRISLAGGVMVLTLAATTMGCVGSAVVTHEMQGVKKESSTNADYSTKYNPWAADGTNTEKLTAEESAPGMVIALILGTQIVLLVFMSVLAVVLVNRNLRAEPIELLGVRGD